jgi:hypothetical protein
VVMLETYAGLYGVLWTVGGGGFEVCVVEVLELAGQERGHVCEGMQAE